MGKSRLFLTAFIMVLAATAAGCADHPVAGGAGHNGAGALVTSSKMTRYGVSRHELAEASALGYAPRKVKGQYLFCRSETLTGTMIPRYSCVGGARLAFDLQEQHRNIERMQRQVNHCYNASCG